VNDPIIWGQIEQELNDTISEGDFSTGDITAVPPSEQLLHLLQLVRERIKVEATFHGNDDRTKNLKLLAYCLKAKSDQEIEVMISNTLGSSLDVSICYYIPKKKAVLWFIASQQQ
jgi:carbohydrate-binding DOMON domain-containing protein